MAVQEAPSIERARDAAARESWAEAYVLLRALDGHAPRALAPEDLDTLADAAWWAGHVDESVDARLRAHAGYAAAGDHRRAGCAAWWLYFEYRELGRPAAAAGWLHRARHHLEREPECPEQCFLAWTDAEQAQGRAPGAALAAAHRMYRIAQHSGSPDLIALSRHAHAAVLLADGRTAEGLALLDDVMCAVTAGELSGMFTGWLYCLALNQCMAAADFGRAVEWTDAAMAWCSVAWSEHVGRSSRPSSEQSSVRPSTSAPVPPSVPSSEPSSAPSSSTPGAGQVQRLRGADERSPSPAAAFASPGGTGRATPTPLTDNPFRGLCRVHHVEVLDLLGAWSRAAAEAERVCEEVMPDCLEAAAAAHYAAGEIMRRRGHLDAAAISYAHAHGLGRIPQPGLALLRLAQGKADAAVTGLRLALACQSAAPPDLLGRARLRAAQTEVALAVGDVDGATHAVAELEALAAGGRPPASAATLLSAMADTARGALELARHGARDPDEALGPLHRALADWLELRIPYEAAQVRMLLAAADRAAGDDEAARLELRAARTAFEQLGAIPDARRAAVLLNERQRGTLPGGLTPREVEVLRLVAAGGTNRDIARELVISEHTVARHLNNIFAKLGVTSRAAATAYAYSHNVA